MKSIKVISNIADLALENDDGLDIPANLRRTPTTEAAPLPPPPAPAPAPVDTTTSVDSDFDLTALRLDQSFTTNGVKKLLRTIPVRRPGPQDFFRTHPDPNYRNTFGVIELKDDREVYLLSGKVLPDLVGEYVTVTIWTTITRQRVLRLWPIRLPDPDGRMNEWHVSAAQAAETAMSKWVRVKANMALGAYETYVAEANIPEPEWPTETFSELLQIAFKDRLIKSTDHPVIKRLRGLS
jgi:hypothetical protein